MSVSTLPIFKALKETGQPQDGKLRNIISYNDDLIFMWDDANGKLLVQGTNKDPYQEITPTNIPAFEVTFIILNEITSKVILWGSHGLLLIDLPQRWGPKGVFENGKEKILVRSQILPQFGGQIIRARIQSGSLVDPNLIVLGSDNVLYIHSLNNLHLKRTFILGKKSNAFLTHLGDTAIDFDFVSNNLLLILKGNGDIFSLYLEGPKSESVEGPLCMTPSADDNYGVDACSILIIQTFPITVVISASSGILYHCLLLPQNVTELHKPLEYQKYKLHVLECLTLELGLQLQNDDAISSNIILKPDLCNKLKYFAIHVSGVHLISLNILMDIKEILEQPLSQITQKSNVDYLICTSADNKLENPLVGFTILQNGLLLIILSNGEIVEHKLKQIEINFEVPTVKTLEDGPITTYLKKTVGFEDTIMELLNKTKNIPLLKISQPDMDAQQCLLLLLTYTKTIRENYFLPFREARNVLNKRATLLKGLLEVQQSKIVTLEMDKEDLQNHAEEMTDKIEKIKENLEAVRDRVQKIMALAASYRVVETEAELEMKNDVKYIEDKIDSYAETVEKLKESQAYQELKIKDAKQKQPEIYLSSQQCATIMSSLKEMSSNIAQVVKEINVMKKHLRTDEDTLIGKNFL